MRRTVSKLISRFAAFKLPIKKRHLFKSTKRKLKREWNSLGQRQRFELRKKMEAEL